MLLASPISYKMDEAGSCCLSSTDEVPGVQNKAENLIQAHICWENLQVFGFGGKESAMEQIQSCEIELGTRHLAL